MKAAFFERGFLHFTAHLLSNDQHHHLTEESFLLSRFVVGYQTKDINCTDPEMPDVYNMLSVPFAGVDGGTIPVTSLQFTNVVRGDGPQDCDFIQIWNGEGGFNNYYCYTDDGEWYNCDSDEPLVDDYADGIPAGTAMWFLALVAEREGAPTFTVSGAVEGSADVTFALNCEDAEMPDVYNMLGNPYPCTWSPNNADQCEIANVARGDGPQDCDFIQVWNGEGGFNNYYCYVDDGVWYNCDSDAELEDDYPDGIPAGTAMWYLALVTEREGDLTITFKNPLAVAE